MFCRVGIDYSYTKNDPDYNAAKKTQKLTPCIEGIIIYASSSSERGDIKLNKNIAGGS